MKKTHNTRETESALRRKAKAHGLELRKSRVRDPEHFAFGTYQLIDTDTNALVLGKTVDGFGMTLAECDEFIGG